MVATIKLNGFVCTESSLQVCPKRDPYVRYIFYVIRYCSFIAAPLLGVGVGYLLTARLFQKYTFPAPVLVGKDLSSSLHTASLHQLGVCIVDEIVDQSLPKETVVSQYPRPGLTTRPHQTIFVTITKKPDILRALDFLHKSYAEIVMASERVKLDVRPVFITSLHESNTCFAQVPEPGAEMIDRKMLVYIAQRNQPLLVVPSLVGLRISTAQASLQQAGLQLELLGDEDVGNDALVEDQYPKPGSIISPHIQQRVQLYRSTLPKVVNNELFS